MSSEQPDRITARVHELMGDGYYKLGEIRKGRIAYQKAGVEITPDKLLIAADAFLEQGLLDVALCTYQGRAERIAPEKLIRCGDACLKRGDLKTASRAYETAALYEQSD